MTTPPHEDGSGGRRRSTGRRIAVAGSEMVTAAAGGFFAGRWLDAWARTGPWFMILGLVGGLGIGLYAAYRAATGDDG
ncbi:protein of unknown function [Candidatus Hydrogenisulfobacillus filiaventi]|uniref:AtpZ/AtpI family protein n=1 Tax=Candidatus Hydrogenisulfobacillus filiaventi TaxID=2707344 RepID=A0A6F8ZDP9_9FIRM|nr:AtpZ/AtpI family protein [Bacillota bacterium]CAB1128136.1 protein of unknown function [Candidatus Hydrogenisulfobacillus filiaventi]